MKEIILFLSLIISFIAMSKGEVPDKILEAINSLQVSPDLFPVHRIDFIVLKNLRVAEEDRKETFPDLEEFIFSSDLILLSNQQSFLVEKESIDKAFLPNKNVIKTLNRRELGDNLEESKIDDIERRLVMSAATISIEKLEQIVQEKTGINSNGSDNNNNLGGLKNTLPSSIPTLLTKHFKLNYIYIIEK